LIFLVPVSVFLSGSFQALSYWNTRNRHFGRQSVARISASLATTGAQLGSGIAGYATGKSLIVASLLGSAVSTLILGWQIWRDESKRLIRSVSLKDIKMALTGTKDSALRYLGGHIEQRFLADAGISLIHLFSSGSGWLLFIEHDGASATIEFN